MSSSSQGIPTEVFLSTLTLIVDYLHRTHQGDRVKYLNEIIHRVKTNHIQYVDIETWKQLTIDKPLNSVGDIYAIVKYITRGDDPLSLIEKPDVITQFSHIEGITTVQAETLYENGYHTLADLWPALTRAQQLSYYYYLQLRQPITREEINRYGGQIIKLLADHSIIGQLIRGVYHITLILKQTTDHTQENAIKLLIDHHIIIASFDSLTPWRGLIRFGESEHTNVHHLRIITESSSQYPFAILRFQLDNTTWEKYQKLAHQKGYTLTDTALVDGEGNHYQFDQPDDIINFLH